LPNFPDATEHEAQRKHSQHAPKSEDDRHRYDSPCYGKPQLATARVAEWLLPVDPALLWS
jgi:hypothetical protein